MNAGEFQTPRFLISLVVIVIFSWVFYLNTHDQILIGTVISAFNLAVGFWLGSSKGAQQNADNLGTALRIADNATPTPPDPPKPDVTIKPGESTTIAAAPEDAN